MRFVLANVLLFSVLSGVLYFQYFFQTPSNTTVASAAGALRSPSSTPERLPNPLPKKSLAEKKPAELDWKFTLNCKNSEQSIKRSTDFLILDLKKCEKEFPNEIIVENESNGFTASVFSVTQTSSKTDSIPLKKGKNVIVIKYQLTKTKQTAKSDVKRDIIERLILEH